jgi:hypothetical protein
MTEQQPPSNPSPRPVNIRDLKPGDMFRVLSGGIAEVVMNPKDGLWVLVCYVEPPPAEPEKGGEEEMVWMSDVGELVEAEQRPE